MKTTVKTKKEKFRKRDLMGWLVMLPTLVLFAFFVWEPLIENIRLSFCTAKMYEITGFAGLENYRKVISDVDFMAAFTNTFSYTFWSLLIGFFIPMVVAVLITETVHLKGLFRTAAWQIGNGAFRVAEQSTLDDSPHYHHDDMEERRLYSLDLYGKHQRYQPGSV